MDLAPLAQGADFQPAQAADFLRVLGEAYQPAQAVDYLRAQEVECPQAQAADCRQVQEVEGLPARVADFPRVLEAACLLARAVVSQLDQATTGGVFRSNRAQRMAVGTGVGEKPPGVRPLEPKIGHLH